MHQHGALYFFENVGTDLNHVVGMDAEDMRIKRAMAESSHGAVFAVRLEYPFAKGLLV